MKGNNIGSTYRGLVIALLLATTMISVSAQDSHPNLKNTSITIGLLQGGGALIGMDFEKMIKQQWSLQTGFGAIGFGAGLNYHLKPQINSNFVSIQLWNQGLLGDDLSQRIVGITYSFRGESSGVTGQIGLGYTIKRSEALTQYLEAYGIDNIPPVTLIYSMVWWF